MTESHRPQGGAVMPCNQVIQRGPVVDNALLPTGQFKQLAELLDRRVFHLDLVRDPPQNASSTRSRGSRFVEKTMNWSNGTQIFRPLANPR